MTKKAPRIFVSLLLMLLCIGIFPVSAFASGGDYPDDTLPAVESSAADTQETKQIGTVTTNGSNLNVRTGAGLDNTAFTQLPNKQLQKSPDIRRCPEIFQGRYAF